VEFAKIRVENAQSGLHNFLFSVAEYSENSTSTAYTSSVAFLRVSADVHLFSANC